MSELIPFTTNDVMARIIKIRGQEVLLDRDVAELYGVETKRINEALRNNPDKFPEGYVFTLQPSEKQEVVENFDRFETLKHSTVEPRAFTERGLYMLATILKSKQATSTTLASPKIGGGSEKQKSSFFCFSLALHYHWPSSTLS